MVDGTAKMGKRMNKNPFPLKIVMPGAVTPSQNQINYLTFVLIFYKILLWNIRVMKNKNKPAYWCLFVLFRITLVFQPGAGFFYFGD